MNYDFSALSGIEFEQLVDKLLDGKTRVVEQYAEGCDNGTDGLVCDIPRGAHIQAKHYLKSGFSKLKNIIEHDEIPKIKNKGLVCYVLATSLNLSQGQAEILRTLIKCAVQEVVVLGSISISSLLDKDSATLKSTVKLWAANADVVRAVLSPSNMNCFYELQNRWEQLNKVFVETPDVKHVVDSLEKNHVAVIAGEPGVGKTTLAEYVCLLYYKEGFDVHFFEGDFSHDDYDLCDSEKKIVFYFDDFLGSTYYNCFSGKQDSSIVNFFKRISKEKNKRFILTSRTNIIQKACIYSERYHDYGLSKQAYIVNVGTYSRFTKAKILFNHLCNSNVAMDEIVELVKTKKYWQIINHRNFNPRLIYFITKQENFEDSLQTNYLDFIKDSLNNPKEIWAKCFTKQLDVSQRLLVQLVVANGGKIQETILNEAYNKSLIVMKIKTPEQERNDFEYVLSVCLKSILRKDVELSSKSKDALISVFNPSVSDYVLPTILDCNTMVKLISCLRTVESIDVVESYKRKFTDVATIYRTILNDFCEQGWLDAKIRLVRLLGFDCGLVAKLVYAAMADEKMITKNNKNDFYFIVLDNLNFFDFSEFIRLRGSSFCKNYQDYGTILEYYKDSVFAKDDVVQYLQKCVYQELKNNVESVLLENVDAEDCTSVDSIEYKLDSFWGKIQEEYPFLTEEEIDDIRIEVDSPKIVEENEADFYYESDDGNAQREQDEDKFIELMFDQLL